MLTKDLIIIGAGGHAHSVIDVVESGIEYHIRGLIDSIKSRGDDVLGYQVLGAESDLERLLSEKSAELFVAIGDNFQRLRIQQKISNRIADVKFATLIHSRAYVSKRSNVGGGSVVMAGAIVNAASELGEGVIINTNATVDHDCLISSFASLAPNVSIGGGVIIGERSSIGLGAKLIHSLTVREDVCIGAGTLVLTSIETGSVVVYGAPSKIVRQRRPDEPYL